MGDLAGPSIRSRISSIVQPSTVIACAGPSHISTPIPTLSIKDNVGIAIARRYPRWVSGIIRKLPRFSSGVLLLVISSLGWGLVSVSSFSALMARMMLARRETLRRLLFAEVLRSCASRSSPHASAFSAMRLMILVHRTSSRNIPSASSSADLGSGIGGLHSLELVDPDPVAPAPRLGAVGVRPKLGESLAMTRPDAEERTALRVAVHALGALRDRIRLRDVLHALDPHVGDAEPDARGPLGHVDRGAPESLAERRVSALSVCAPHHVLRRM